jgi:catechol 2,3-dioxygenase-like lactoylglutathione lyase family enzyme
MDVKFMTSIAPIVRDPDTSRSFYADGLGLDFEGHEGDYVFTHQLEGTKHFGLWALSEAANACFGTTQWPAEIPVPQASIEFEVADHERFRRAINTSQFGYLPARSQPASELNRL